MEDLNNGGASFIAFGYLKYTDISSADREELRSGLLRYCEINIHAVMIIRKGCNRAIYS